MYLLYDDYGVLSTWKGSLSSGANGVNTRSFGCNRGLATNSLAVVEYDLAVYAQRLLEYNSRTPSGISRIVYLHSDLYSIYMYIYTVYAQPCSGAYRGGTVGSVREIAAHDHRESMVINTGAAIYLWWNPVRKSHLSTVDYITNRNIRIFLLWLMRHTKNSHNSTLYCTLSHYARHHTLRSGANTQALPPHTDQYFTLFCTYWSQ